MSEEGAGASSPPQGGGNRPRRFLDTLKGQIIALTGVVAALYGLWAAIQQFIPKHEPMPSPSSTPAVSAAPTARGAQPSNSENKERRDQSSTTAVPSAPQSAYSTGAEVTVRNFTFKIVGAQLDDHRKENTTLRFTIQIMNKANYDTPIDDKVCRLVVDGVPRAPIRGWVAMASAHSAVNADFVYISNGNEVGSLTILGWW